MGTHTMCSVEQRQPDIDAYKAIMACPTWPGWQLSQTSGMKMEGTMWQVQRQLLSDHWSSLQLCWAIEFAAG